jgi:uncharacterized protein YqgC (DUF456 family)
MMAIDLDMIGGTTLWSVLMLINAVAVFLVLAQLPGTWLIVLATAVATLIRPGPIEHTTLAVLAGLALLGELVEFAGASAGAAKAGGSKRGALLSLVGALIGAIVGSAAMLIIGTIIGACIGAGIGSYLGDRWAGRSNAQAMNAGRGAATGRLVGTAAKATIAATMWLVTLAAVLL